MTAPTTARICFFPDCTCCSPSPADCKSKQHVFPAAPPTTLAKARAEMEHAIADAWRTDDDCDALNHHFGTYTALADRIIGERDAEIARLREAGKVLLSVIDRVGIAEGVCCCGDAMASHSIASGHSPVDVGEYHDGPRVASARAALEDA